MGTKGLMTAVTLYQAGTLTFTQAANRTGATPESFARAIKQYEPAEQHNRLKIN